MAAEDIARNLRLWAIANGLIPRDQLAPNSHVPAATAQVTGVPDITSDASEALRSVGVSFIGFNDAENEVVIYTNKIVRKKIKAKLPRQATDGVTVAYQVGAPELIGKLPPSPFGTTPGQRHNGRYACGSSIHVGNRLGAGTFGCLVRDQHGELFGLTNNHVSGNCGYATNGLPILAPGPCDVAANSVDPFCIGHHDACLRMVHGAPDNPNVSPNDNMDAAIFKIIDENAVTSMQKDNTYDTPSIVGPIVPGAIVEKVGRTTGRTAGKVRAQVSGPFHVRYKMPELDIDFVVFYEPVFAVESTQRGGVFSLPGDSGALVTTLDANNVRSAIGLVFAGDSHRTSFILPLQPILQKFNATIVSGHNV